MSARILETISLPERNEEIPLAESSGQILHTDIPRTSGRNTHTQSSREARTQVRASHFAGGHTESTLTAETPEACAQHPEGGMSPQLREVRIALKSLNIGKAQLQSRHQFSGCRLVIATEGE